jgi:hypothetical protein
MNTNMFAVCILLVVALASVKEGDAKGAVGVHALRTRIVMSGGKWSGTGSVGGGYSHHRADLLPYYVPNTCPDKEKNENGNCKPVTRRKASRPSFTYGFRGTKLH